MPVIYFMPDAWLQDHGVWSSILVVALLTALAALSWTMFENPIRRNGVFGPMKQFRAHPLEALRPITLGSTITLAAVIAIGVPAVFAMDASKPNTAMSLPEDAQRWGSRDRSKEEDNIAEPAESLSTSASD